MIHNSLVVLPFMESLRRTLYAKHFNSLHVMLAVDIRYIYQICRK
jgi:hypothetical protein